MDQGWGMTWWELGILSLPFRTSPIRQTRPLALALRPMELRNDGRHKENVAPRPATPLRPGKRLGGSGEDVAGTGSTVPIRPELLFYQASLIPEMNSTGPAGPGHIFLAWDGGRASMSGSEAGRGGPGVGLAAPPPHQVGLCLGSGWGASPLGRLATEPRLEAAPRQIQILMHMPVSPKF